MAGAIKVRLSDEEMQNLAEKDLQLLLAARGIPMDDANLGEVTRGSLERVRDGATQSVEFVWKPGYLGIPKGWG